MTHRPSMPVPASFDRQARVTVPGYDALHDLGGCLLKVMLKRDARVLVVGAGTGQGLFSLRRHGKAWRFTAVEPSHDMIAKAQGRMVVEGVDGRSVVIRRSIEDVPKDQRFDAATMTLVLHLLETKKDKLRLLRRVAKRLRPGSPLLITIPCTDLDEDDLFVKAWRTRLVSQGMNSPNVESQLNIERARIAPMDAAQVVSLLEATGFLEPRIYFSSLFYKAWVARRA